MGKIGLLPVKDNRPVQTLRELLIRWLESGHVSALLVPAVSPAGVVAPVLWSDPEKASQIYPLLPVMGINSAGVVAEIAADKAEGSRLGVVLRPCEMRAVVELIKLQQIARDNLVLIGMDCAGTYKPTSLGAELKNDAGELENWITGFLTAQDRYLKDERLRRACQLCEFPVPLVYDVALGFLGVNPKEQLLIQSGSELGDMLLSEVNISPVAAVPAERQAYLDHFISKRQEQAVRAIADFDRAALGPENLVRYFASCINCHNCMKVCPVCYCRECFFDSEVLKRDLDSYIRVSRRKGLNRMPADTLLFHLTRMNHMMTSCVQCGICEDSCPAGIGLSVMFKKVSREAQAAFEYLSGRSLEEPLPLTTFREDEFRQIGED